MNYINIPTEDKLPISEDEYWRLITRDKSVTPLKKPCHDCAITTGFYLEHAESLMKQPKIIQEKVIGTWYCHNNLKKGCAGIRNFQKKSS